MLLSLDGFQFIFLLRDIENDLLVFVLLIRWIALSNFWTTEARIR